MSDELKRSDDLLIGKLIQAIEDDRRTSQEWREKHDAESKKWRDSIDERLKPIEAWVNGASAFWKVLAAIAGIGVPAVAFIGWFRGHWK